MHCMTKVKRRSNIDKQGGGGSNGGDDDDGNRFQNQSECQGKNTNQGSIGGQSNRDSKPEVTAKKPKVEETSPPPPPPPVPVSVPPPPPPSTPIETKPNEDSTRSHNGEKTDDVVTPRLKALDVKESSIRRINEEALRSIGIKSLDDGALRSLGIKGFDEGELKNVEDSYGTYLQYAAAAEPYIYWYDAWRTSAFRPWPSLSIKDSKSQTILRDSIPQSVPAYLSQGPPVLLHPERVIPLSESERFERSFQPNVALAPALHHRPKIECSEKQVKCEPESIEDSKKAELLCPPPPATTERKAVLTVVASSRYNSEIELSTDTDDSSSEATGEHGSIPRGERVVEQVAEVLDALSDAKEATRARVVALVQQLASRLNLEEANVRRLEEENSELRHVQREQEDLLASKDRRIAQLQQRLQEADSSSNKSVQPFQDKVIAMEKEIRTSHSDMNGSSEHGATGGRSPISVITSSPNVVIKTEPTE
ncbi:hypothetical protein Phum_PHUM530130 [Pediculus humanus corporis]|uniref:Uncharacterized protein n=1 Tax=Pediculus humanus subsp. corporis TaxID=121224 RepID=E0VZC2_PEDHC|nr:uncharacterized protein Phum_PHUM530130 [Pediculus humanus corporis]EEB18728.1 hypothetical protein Phum_PHUM530130 [Pediculus humanus corporis]